MSENLDPKAVEAFLRAHPNFLQDRPGFASRQKLAELSDISRENDRLLDATRNTILALLAGENRADLSRIWLHQVADTFQAEMGALLWLDESSGSAGEAPLASKLIRHGESFSGVLRPEEMQAVFGTDATEGSAALVAIRSGGYDIGVLGVGSHDTQRYRAEDGTLFLDYLAEVIGQLPACH